MTSSPVRGAELPPRTGARIGARAGAIGRALVAALALLALLAGTLPAAAAPGDDALRPAAERPELAAIRDFLRKGERGRALEAARAAVSANPEDVETHALLQDASRGQTPVSTLQAEYKARHEQRKTGDSAYLYGRLLLPAEGEKLLSEATKADPKGYWAMVGLAEVEARLGKAAAAEAAALAALELRPGDARAAARAGAQCALARRFPAAETCYRKAIEAAPGDANSRLGLAHAILRQGKADAASTALDDLRRTAKSDPRVLLLDAAIAAEKGDLAAAEKALVQATTASPTDVDAGMQLALLRLRRAQAIPRPPGKNVDAKSVAPDVAALQKGAATFPDRAEFRYALGYSKEITGDVDGAVEDYREASRLDPLDGSVLAAIGAILVAKGQLEEAGREFRNALDRDPEDAGALFQLGFVLDQQGKPKESVPVYQRLVKVHPQDARAWHALGAALDLLGKAGEAKGAFEKAVELDSASPRFQRDLGEVLYGMKAWVQAEKALAKAAELDPKDDLAWTGLARARTQMRKYKEGAEAYEKAAELRTKDKDLQILIGAYYHEFLMDYEKAVQHYNKYVQLGGDAADVEDWQAEAEAELAKKEKK
jgi:tetratricopeptide (TPR) repeat protein